MAGRKSVPPVQRVGLSPGLKYRRESFGGIAFLPHNMTSRFFNHAASWAIEQFAVPIELSTAVASLSQITETQDAASALISNFLAAGLLTEVHQDGDGKGRMFFTDVTDFSLDRLHAPVGVECELTLRCMRRCTYCAYESSPDVGTSGELTREDWGKILKRLDSLGVFYVRFTGGDPLTRPDALSILRTASDLGFAVSIASDLTVITAEHARTLAGLNNLSVLQTTLDGPSPEIADSQRGRGNFNRVIRGLALLSEFDIPVIVGTVVTKRNAGHVGEIASLLSQWGNVVGYCVSPLYDAGRGRELKKLVPSAEELALAYEQFAKAVERGVVKPADPAWDPLAGSLSPEQRHQLWANQPSLVRSPDRLLRIDPRGRAYTSIHVKEIFGDDVYVGNVMQSDVMDLWNNSPLLTGIRSLRHSHPYFGDVVDIARISELKEAQYGE